MHHREYEALEGKEKDQKLAFFFVFSVFFVMKCI